MKRTGYSGVAIYTRNSTCAPIRVEEGVTGVLCPPKSTTSFRNLPPNEQIGGYPRSSQLSGTIDDATLDSEGRCVILEFPAFVLFGVYSPANRDETRDDFRTGFFQALDVRIRNLVAEGKQVILTGDLNVIRSPIDSTNVAETLRKEGLSIQDWMSTPVRRTFNQMIFEGSVSGPRDEGREEPVLWDLCRCFHPDREGMNTCWDTKRNTRPANNGSRIDYVLCSDGIKKWFTHANIQEGLMGSDHCPVYATMGDRVVVDNEEVHLLDVMNPPGMFKDGQRCREWSSKDLLSLSARLIPEFDRRQSIRDMFTKKATPASLSQQTSETTSALLTKRDVTPTQRDGDDAQTRASSVGSSQTTDATSGPAKTMGLPKRPVETSDVAKSRPQKKSRSSTNAENSKNKTTPGQTTLQGFFKPKVPASPSKAEPLSTKNTANSSSSPTKFAANSVKPNSNPATSSVKQTSDPCVGSCAEPTVPWPEPPHSTAATPDSPERVFDPIQAKESWSKLLSKRVAPRCEHDEPCISLTTKKAGVNCGKFALHPLHSPCAATVFLSFPCKPSRRGQWKLKLTFSQQAIWTGVIEAN